jgi:hypothetical protein
MPRLDNSEHVRITAWIPKKLHSDFKKIYPQHGAISKFVTTSIRRKVIEVELQVQTLEVKQPQTLEAKAVENTDEK